MQPPLDPAVKKAYEVSYALFRVAAILPSRAFADSLEKEALNLLRSTVANSQEEAQSALTTIHYLVAFGKDTNSIHQENADLLAGQLEALASMLRDRSRNEITPADLSRIFTSADPSPDPEGPRQAKALPRSKVAASGSAAEPVNSNVILLSDRQSVILEKIRQTGNCRTRDIQAALPDLSERTLRYDLQRLVEEGKIERGGGGGPASWYRIKGDPSHPSQ